MLIRHPSTRRHYVHVFIDETPNPDVYTDTRPSWKRAGLPWMTVMGQREFAAAKASLLGDPSVAIVLWGDIDASLPPLPDRRCLLTTVYVETLGPEELLTEYQKKQLESFEAHRNIFDAIIVQTPPMVEAATLRGWHPVLCPTAWDPAVVGIPDFSAKKQLSVATYGVKYGHRIEAFSIAKRILGSKLIETTGFFGKLRKSMLDSAVAILTLLHCPGCSYPTMRLWQAASTSAALISEIVDPNDAWPAISGEHYLPLPLLSEATVPALEEVLVRLSNQDAMLSMARRAFEDLKQFTPSFCMESYLVPGLEDVR